MCFLYPLLGFGNHDEACASAHPGLSGRSTTIGVERATRIGAAMFVESGVFVESARRVVGIDCRTRRRRTQENDDGTKTASPARSWSGLHEEGQGPTSFR